MVVAGADVHEGGIGVDVDGAGGHRTGAGGVLRGIVPERAVEGDDAAGRRRVDADGVTVDDRVGKYRRVDHANGAAVTAGVVREGGVRKLMIAAAQPQAGALTIQRGGRAGVIGNEVVDHSHVPVGQDGATVPAGSIIPDYVP